MLLFFLLLGLEKIFRNIFRYIENVIKLLRQFERYIDRPHHETKTNHQNNIIKFSMIENHAYHWSTFNFDGVPKGSVFGPLFFQ